MYIICKQKNIFKDYSTFLWFQSQYKTVSLYMILSLLMHVNVKYTFNAFCPIATFDSFLFVCLEILNMPRSSQILKGSEYIPSEFCCITSGLTLHCLFFRNDFFNYFFWIRTQMCANHCTWVKIHILEWWLGKSDTILMHFLQQLPKKISLKWLILSKMWVCAGNSIYTYIYMCLHPTS